MTPREEVNKVWEQYDPESQVAQDELNRKYRADAAMLQDIQEMMNTRGWKEWYYPMFDQIILNLNSIEGTDNLKQLLARKDTLKAFRLLQQKLEELQGIGENAIINLESQK